ncbi:KxYKxGKxW signal peptide domain-containing protein, partial [Staphylococcus gallinarum]
MFFFKSKKNMTNEPKHRVKLYKVGKHWVQKGLNELSILIDMNLPSKIDTSRKKTLKKTIVSITMGGISSIYTINNNAYGEENNLPITSELSVHSETLGNNNSTTVSSEHLNNNGLKSES